MTEKLEDLLVDIQDRLEDEFMNKYTSWSKILTWLNKRLDEEAATTTIKLTTEDYWNYNTLCSESLNFSKSLYTNLWNSNKSLKNDEFMLEVFNQMVSKRFEWIAQKNEFKK